MYNNKLCNIEYSRPLTVYFLFRNFKILKLFVYFQIYIYIYFLNPKFSVWSLDLWTPLCSYTYSTCEFNYLTVNICYMLSWVISLNPTTKQIIIKGREPSGSKVSILETCYGLWMGVCELCLDMDWHPGNGKWETLRDMDGWSSYWR